MREVVLGVAVALAGSLSAAAMAQMEIPPEQLNSFFSRIPKYGEPARQAMRNEALRDQYERQVDAAEANGYAVRAQARALDHQDTVESWGTPDTKYSNGGYERRTYRRGGTIYGITTKDGLITDFSEYDTGR